MVATVKCRKVLHADTPQFAEQPAENVAAQVLAVVASDAGIYSHILLPAAAHGKNVAPRVVAQFNGVQICDITKVMEGDNRDTFERPVCAAPSTIALADAGP